VRREAETLAASGRPVEVFCLRNEGEPERDERAGVTILRLPVRRHQGAGMATYLGEYLHFFWRAGLLATRRHRRRHYALLQVHTLPDWLVFAGLPIRLAGVPLLLDLHEAMPEFFRTRFPGASRRSVLAALRLAERASIAAADAVITVNEALAERLRGIGVPAEKVTVIVNSPDASLFDLARHPLRSFMGDGFLRLIYAGAVTPLYNLDVAVEALALLAREDGGDGSLEVRLEVYGRGDALDELRELVAARGVAGRVTFHGRVPLEEVAGRIAEADAGLAPVRHVPFTDFSLSAKLFEYTAMGKPVIAARLPTVERYFGADGLLYFRPGDPVSLAETVRRLAATGPDAREAQVAAARAAAERLSWRVEGARYVELVERLTSASHRSTR